MSSPKKLYTLLVLLCIGGYSYLCYNWLFPTLESGNNTLCVFKTVTQVPCPSCGSTRSVMAILKGNFIEGIYLNPLGYILFAALILLPIWILFDVLMKKHSLFYFVERITQKISQKPYAIVFIVLVLLNWVWNINKGL